MEVDTRAILGEIESSCKKIPNIQEIRSISTASTPVLKLDYTHGNIITKVDITVKDERHKGMECLRLVKQYIKKYDCLKKLLLVFKYIIKLANLNDPYHVTYL